MKPIAGSKKYFLLPVFVYERITECADVYICTYYAVKIYDDRRQKGRGR